MFLAEILELKKKSLERAKQTKGLADMESSARSIRKGAEKFRLQSALRQNRINIIAEIKRASPSKGDLNTRIDVRERVKSYKQGGAAAISVLTEEDRFSGSLADLRAVAEETSLPVLRKDFIFEKYQIFEAADAGADAVLLIAAMLNDSKLRHLYQEAVDLGMDVLLETHNRAELVRAANLGAKIIGINNRDLNTFDVSLDVSRNLVKHAPPETLMVCESGLSTREDILEMKKLGFDGFLIGESLMKSDDVTASLAGLVSL